MDKDFRKRLFDLLEQMDELQSPTSVDETERIAESSSGEKQCCECWVGPNHDTRKRYSSEFKKMIVRLHKEEGYTFERVRNEFGVSKASVTKWCSDARYENMAMLGEREKELQAMRQDYEKVKEENAFLKQIVVLVFGKEMGVRA